MGNKKWNSAAVCGTISPAKRRSGSCIESVHTIPAPGKGKWGPFVLGTPRWHLTQGCQTLIYLPYASQWVSHHGVKRATGLWYVPRWSNSTQNWLAAGKMWHPRDQVPPKSACLTWLLGKTPAIRQPIQRQPGGPHGRWWQDPATIRRNQGWRKVPYQRCHLHVAANISEKERYSGWLRNPAQVDRWLLPLFIGFQPSFWWCRISQPSTVCMCMKIRITTIFEFSFLNPETSSDL